MIIIKKKGALQKMVEAGSLLAHMFKMLTEVVRPGVSTAKIDDWIAQYQRRVGLVSCSKGYRGYRHASCISINDVVVHGVPRSQDIIKDGDLVKVDVCASFKGYCADMARCFFIGQKSSDIEQLVSVAQYALDEGIAKACNGNRIGDISSAIEQTVLAYNYGIVQEFAGHGIGRKMHEDPEILNYGKPSCGPVIRPGMAFAIEPMITLGDRKIYIASDGWTVKTVDGSIAAHVEDTVIVTDNGPKIITRL